MNRIPRTAWLYVLVGAISALTVSISMPHGFLVAAGDATTPELSPHVALAHLASTWGAAAGMGRDISFYRPLLFPTIFVDLVLAKLGLPAIFINQAWLYAVVIAQSCFTLRLILRIFPAITYSPALVFGALASIFNPFMLMQMHSIFLSTLISLAVFPALLCVAIAYVEEQRLQDLLEFVLWALVCASAVNFAVPTLEGAILWAGICLTAVSCAFRTRARAFAPLVPLALIYAGVMLIWSLPSYHWAHIVGSEIMKETTKYSSDTLRVSSMYSSLSNAARLIGQYLFFNDIGGKPFVVEGRNYVTQWWLIAATSVLPALAVLALLFAGKKRARVWCIGAIALAALFMAKGTAPPGGGIFEWLFVHIAVFSAFRNAFDKFAWIVALAYALLAAFALDAAARRVGRSPRVVFTAASFAALLVGAYPFFLGHMFWAQSAIKIPSRYYDVARWIDNRGERSLQLPVAPASFDTYAWGYVGSGILFNLIESPLLSRVYDLASPGNTALDDLFQNYDAATGDRQAAYALGLFDFGNIISDASIRTDYFGAFYAATPAGALPRTRLAAKFGSISVYAVDNDLLNPEIYAADRIFIGPSEIPQLAYVCGALGTCKGTAFVSALTVKNVLRGVPYGVVNFRAADTPVTDARSMRIAIGGGTSAATARWVEAPAGAAAALQGGAWSLPVSAGSQGVSFADFANRTIASRPLQPETDLLTLAGHPPVVFSISSGTAASQDFHAVWESKAVRVCADPGTTSLRQVDIPAKQIVGSIALLAFQYTSSGADVSIRLLDPQEPRKGFYAVLDSAGNRTAAWARLFRAGSRAGILQLQISARAARAGGCAELHGLAIARARNAARWHLVGVQDGFELTPPYVAAYPRAIGDDLNTFAKPPGAVAPHDNVASIPTTAPWSAPVMIKSGAERPVIGARAVSAVKDAPIMFRSYGALAALVANFSHLVPSAKYTLDFTLSKVRGEPPYMTLIANEVAIAVYNPKVDSRSVITFSVPGNATEVNAYLYFGNSAAAYSSGQVTRPSLRLLNASGQMLSISSTQRAARPRSVDYAWTSPGEGDVLVRAAPRRYLLVFDSSYSPDWELQAPPGITAAHVKANLFANAWVLDGAPGSYKLHLHYRNDDVALKAGLAGVFLMAIGLLYDAWRRHAVKS